MMERIELRACSDSDLVRPVFWAMADTNSAFLKLITSSDDLDLDAAFFLAAYIAVLLLGRRWAEEWLAPLSLSGAIEVEVDEVMRR